MIHLVISFYKFASHVSRKHSLNLFEAHIVFFYNALKNSEATPSRLGIKFLRPKMHANKTVTGPVQARKRATP